MKMTLRQAHKLVEKINAKIGTIELSPSKDVTAWNVDKNTLSNLREEFATNLERVQALNAARYAVREQIGVGNRAEVDQLVGTRKYLLDQIGVLRTLVAGVRSSAVVTADALDAKAYASRTAAATGGTSRYGGEDTITVGLLMEDEVKAHNAAIDNLQLKIEEVEDQLTSANASRDTSIILSDAVLATLRSEGLLK